MGSFHGRIGTLTTKVRQRAQNKWLDGGGDVNCKHTKTHYTNVWKNDSPLPNTSLVYFDYVTNVTNLRLAKI
jgi:hypothetical protein